ncbi:heavy metal translocating P-type ATPase [Pedobacter frigoris]|uniref:heavy metal translocating P-type ATPase n=1 Tax=Pedobacter frigoris TaxID=2571272 RepID=UPI00292F9953|nr:heavy metal translocating P-type ATPase metal-binding domain-containing protein [Pedobacter frigoris]
MFTEKTIDTETQCYHCGDELPSKPYFFDDRQFCCLGCQGVYKILSDNNLCNYYIYNDVPGQTQKHPVGHFEYLDEPSIMADLVDYMDEKNTVITLFIPAIHCSSCIWLLENLHKINPAVRQSRIDFLKKTVKITFKNQDVSLRKVVEMLVSIGYEPLISLQDVVKKQQSDRSERNLVAKIAVAGFCFGNVMLLSFPDYFGLSRMENEFRTFFGWLNIAFCIPVTFYSGRDYFISAYTNLKNKVLNLDFPLALGITVMFMRTLAEIITGTGAGFADTLCGLIFFLLIGKWMQQRTYHHLSFERDYRSYFPVAVTIIKNGETSSLPLGELKQGHRILIRSNEIIPADAILLKGEAEIDFSFVTGESIPVTKTLGEIVYAGGRQLGSAIELEVIKPVSQSYLTSLWNNEAFFSEKDRIKTFSDTASKYFSIALLLIAGGAGAYWMFTGEAEKAIASFTAVLIIACPCALALSSPFTLAAVLSILDKNKFYLKSTAVVEELARIDTFVFDKTGTITNPEATGITFKGNITAAQKQLVNDLAANSGHPLSRELVQLLNIKKCYPTVDYTEKIGRGISGRINGIEVKLGSSAFIGLPLINSPMNSAVHVMINGEYLGHFLFEQQWRKGFKDLIFKLSKWADLHLLSGDQDHDKHTLIPFFPSAQQMRFQQTPQHKLEYIKALQQRHKKIMMLGDGLNDAGALRQSNVGVAVTDNINNFSPDCDAILDGAAFHKLPMFIRQAKDAVTVIHLSFAISLAYNALGLYFAVQGILSPLFAAVLMPLSTVTIILFTSIAIRLYARKNKLL